ncbi:transcriptional regulator [Lacticaseibacillus thailandensis DSM 22698 = JCM 13996]|uniref:Transcriptional regulator n=2 Tax=Lacticaseibacillus thailandensis TaxID=381741 RepID=A0A0R2C469_9LACO|nr:transcriptional regulator [Lacticaseibacillus thailandensis DSM 22698 = JCM 13996]
MMAAAKTEFTRAVFAKASISNIIELAGVPRGSFYQYFEDKQDIFYYLLETEGQRFVDAFKAIVEAHHGDFFASVTEFFDVTIDRLLEGDDAPFFRNVFSNMNFKSASHAAFGENVHRHGAGRRYLQEHIDFSGLRVTNNQQKELLFRTTMGGFAQSLAYFYNHQEGEHPDTVAKVKERMAWLLDWLQHGVLLKGESHA